MTSLLLSRDQQTTALLFSSNNNVGPLWKYEFLHFSFVFGGGFPLLLFNIHNRVLLAKYIQQSIAKYIQQSIAKYIQQSIAKYIQQSIAKYIQQSIIITVQYVQYNNNKINTIKVDNAIAKF